MSAGILVSSCQSGFLAESPLHDSLLSGSVLYDLVNLPTNLPTQVAILIPFHREVWLAPAQVDNTHHWFGFGGESDGVTGAIRVGELSLLSI